MCLSLSATIFSPGSHATTLWIVAVSIVAAVVGVALNKDPIGWQRAVFIALTVCVCTPPTIWATIVINAHSVLVYRPPVHSRAIEGEQFAGVFYLWDIFISPPLLFLAGWQHDRILPNLSLKVAFALLVFCCMTAAFSDLTDALTI